MSKPRRGVKDKRQGKSKSRASHETVMDNLVSEGLQMHQQGRLDLAETIYQRVLQRHPRHPDALHLLGFLFTQCGRYEQAIALLRKALTHKASIPSVHIHLGNAYRGVGKLDAAAGCYQQALHLQPESADAYNNLGNVMLEQGAHEAAGHYFNESLRVQPDCAETHYNIGRVLHARGRLEEAHKQYDCALQLRPDFAEAHNNLGVILQGLGYLDSAVTHFQEAIRLQPDSAEPHNNLSMALKKQGHVVAAMAHYREAIQQQPGLAEAYYNSGNAYQEQGAIETAIACFKESIRVQPDFVEGHWNLALALLLTGRYQEAWLEYEWRFRRDGTPFPDLPRPRWNGAEFKNQTLLVWAEQGYGDTIQFVRYLPEVKSRGGRVVLACQPVMERLLQPCAGFDHLVTCPPEAIDPDLYDLQVSLLSLPGLLETTVRTIPAEIPYLTSQPDKVQAWREGLPKKEGLHVGIVWAGNPQHGNDQNRSCRLDDLAPLSTIPDVVLHSLQKGHGAEQITSPPAGMKVTDLSDHVDDFTDTAAVLSNLDLVITVDTAVAHLAGALGRPVWLLLPFVPDWRWLLERQDTPWYPTMRLWRQAAPGDWMTVVQGMCEALRRLCHQEKQLRPEMLHTTPKCKASPFSSRTASHNKRLIRRPNVLFSTTRMWNPGDDFILFGVRHLLESLIGPFNSIVYNRHPDLHQLRLHFNQPATVTVDEISVQANLYDLLSPHLTPRDNSWHPGIGLDRVDLAVFAGTPEWLGDMVAPLVNQLLWSRVPALYLGIGSFEGIADMAFDQISLSDRLLLNRATYITVRDETCAKILGPLQPMQLPCPALFAAKTSRPRHQKKRLALSTQGSDGRNGQHIDPVTREYSVALFKALAKQYDCALICHYVDEAQELSNCLGNDMAVYYAYDARDYIDIYDDFDLTVTTRVHGAGLCASLGIPGFVIGHSARSATVRGFLADILHPQHDGIEQAIERIGAYDVSAASERLCAHKEETLKRYIALLEPVIREIGF